MDLLDRIHPAASALLDRIDATLIAAGAPADHPVLPLLRRVGALPGDLVAQLAAVTADPLVATGDALRRQSEGYETGQGSAPIPAAWRGPAAESFAARWSTLSGYLAGDSASMAGRLDTTASYLDAVGAWLARGRRALAGALAECLGSAEAATLRAGAVDGPATTSREAARAAADLGAHILDGAAEILDDGRRVLDAWAGRLGELPYPAQVPVATSVQGQLEIG